MAWALALLVGGLAYVCGRYRPSWALNRKSVASKPLDSEEPTIESPAADPDAINAVLSAMAETEALWVGQADRSEGDPPRRRQRRHAAKPVQETSVTIEITQPVEIDVDAIEAHEAQVINEPDTVIMEMPDAPAGDRTATRLDYNLSDLDGRAQHVEMPASLHEHAVVVERRKNVIDSLMAAIHRDPTRGDLRMKLLETLTHRSREESACL